MRSAFDATFLALVNQWILETGEVFVVIRYAYGGGAKDYHFFQSFRQFRAVLASLPPLADVVVFRTRQLPIRGIADRNLLERALQGIPDGEWWFLLCREGEGQRYQDWGSNSRQELQATFEELEGKYVAVGVEPPYSDPDNPDMQSGVTPLPDGTIRPAPR